MTTEGYVYPGRGASARSITRRNPVFYDPHEAARALSGDQLACYAQTGFVIIPDVFPASEIARLKEEMQRLRKECGSLPKSGSDNFASPGGSLCAVHSASRLFAELGAGKRIVDRVKQILGGEVYLCQSRIDIADTTADGAPWYSQPEYGHPGYGMPLTRCVEAWIMLTDSTPYNGPMQMLHKSHRVYSAYSSNTPRMNDGPGVETFELVPDSASVVTACGSAGTLVLRDGNLLCGSASSVVPFPRAVAMFSYSSVEGPPKRRPRPHGARSLLSARTPKVVVQDRAAAKVQAQERQDTYPATSGKEVKK